MPYPDTVSNWLNRGSVMSFMKQDLEVPQIKLVGFPDRPFYANNNSEVRDQVVIDQTVLIIDSILPQTFGRYGGHY